MLLSNWFQVSVFLVCEIVGTPLMVGIFVYERFEGDPMKRNLTDMVVSNCVVGLLLTNWFVYPVLFWAKFVSPVPLIIGYAYDGCRKLLFFVAFLGILEVLVIKVLIRHFWKRAPPINEDFFACFFAICNLSFGSFWFGTRVLSGVVGEVPHLLNGLDAAYFRPNFVVTSFKPGLVIGVLIFVLSLHELFFLCPSVIKKLKNVVLPNKLAPMPNVEQGNIGLHLNNHERNEEVISLGNHLLFGIFGVSLCFLVPHMLLRSWTFNTVRTLDIVFTLESMRNVFAMVFGPLPVYVFSPKLRRYVYNSLKKSIVK